MDNIKIFNDTLNTIIEHNININDGYLIKFGQIDANGNLFTKETNFNIPDNLKNKIHIDEKGIKFS